MTTFKTDRTRARNAYGDKLRHYIFTLARFDGKWHILAETLFILTPIHPAKQTTKSHVLLYLPQSSKGYPSHALSRFLITFASAFRKKFFRALFLRYITNTNHKWRVFEKNKTKPAQLCSLLFSWPPLQISLNSISFIHTLLIRLKK